MIKNLRVPRSLVVLLLAAILLLNPNGTESSHAKSVNNLDETSAIPATQIAQKAISSIDIPLAEDPAIDFGNDASQEKPATTNTNGFSIPEYTGSAATAVNDNTPYFDSALIARAEKGSFEEYTSLDDLGRATCAFACAGPETMPEGERGSIGHVKPSGFSLARYDWVDGKYLFNRCHLIGWQITGENDNVKNLVTGTRYMNVEGMLPYENDVANYIERTGNHVLYRATAMYEGENLVSRGVLIEARSVEDSGSGLNFCVFCFNVQPGVSINYATGASEADGTMQEEDLVDESQFDYILNTNTGKIHKPSCSSVDDMKEKNKRGFNGTVGEAKAQGFTPCSRCNP